MAPASDFATLFLGAVGLILLVLSFCFWASLKTRKEVKRYQELQIKLCILIDTFFLSGLILGVGCVILRAIAKGH